MVIGHWKHIVSHDELQRSSHSLSVVNGIVYLFGGELFPREPRDNKMFKISIANENESNAITKVESSTGQAPSPRVGSAATSLRDKLYLFSGRGGQAMKPIEENGSLHVYDPVRDTWDVLKPADASAPYPQARSYHCISSDGTSTIFIHAGCPESGRLADLWAFDITARRWDELQSAPGPQRGGASIAYLDGKLYRMNGFDGKTEQGGAIDVFDIANKAWSTKSFQADSKAGPEARSVSALVPLNLSGKKKLVTLFGERDPSSLGHAGAGKMLGDWWVYDINMERWERGDSTEVKTPEPRGWFDAAVVNDDSLVVVGGLSESNDRLKDVWTLLLS